MDCQEQPKKTYNLSYLVNQYRTMSDESIDFLYTFRNDNRLEFPSCDMCGGTGIVYSMNGEDDIDKDVCETCDAFEARVAIEFHQDVVNMFKWFSLRGRKNGTL